MRKIQKSYLDAYHDEIIDLLAQGMYIKHIADYLSEKYSTEVKAETVHQYVKQRNLRAKHSILDAPVCDHCQKCINVQMQSGKKHRVCLVARKMVVDSVTLSPMWCGKREPGRIINHG